MGKVVMSWQSARASAALLAERLKLLDTSRGKGRVERRKTPRDAEAAPAPAPQAPEPFFVKPARVAPPPSPSPAPVPAPLPTLTDLIDDDFAEAGLIDVEEEMPLPPEEPEEDTPEARRAPRKSQSLPAFITSPEMANGVPARVVDMSATGARIELTPIGRAKGVPMTHLPERLLLVLRHDRMEVDCVVVWREEWQVGLRFLGFPRPSPLGRR